MTFRLSCLLAIAVLSACPPSDLEPTCINEDGDCAPDYPDGGYSLTGCTLTPNYLTSAWPSGTGNVPRNLHVFSVPSDFAVTGADGGDLLARYRTTEAALEVHGAYYLLLFEATPFETEALFQTPVAATLPEGAPVEVWVRGTRTGSFTAHGIDLEPPAPPTVELLEVMPERRRCVFGAAYRTHREPDTLLLVRPASATYSAGPFDVMALTEGDEVLIADKLGGWQSYEFIAIDKAGNRSAPTLVTVPLGEREPSSSQDVLIAYGARRASYRTGIRLRVEAGPLAGHLYPLSSPAVTVSSGTCTASVSVRSDGRADLDVQAAEPTRCVLQLSAVSRGNTVTLELPDLALEDAAPLRPASATPACADGTPLQWPVGGTSACRAPLANDRLRFGPPGAEVEVRGTVVATLDPDHLLVCDEEECTARDASGAATSSWPRPIFPYYHPGFGVLSNSHLSPHTPSPRLIGGSLSFVDPGWSMRRLHWDGNQLTDSFPSVPEPQPGVSQLSSFVPWAGTWTVEGPDSQRHTVRIYEAVSGDLVAELPARPHDLLEHPTYQVVEPYLRVEDKLYLSPTEPFVTLPPDVHLTAGAGCYLAGTSFNGPIRYEGAILWWLDVCGATPRFAVGHSPDPLLPAWVPTSAGLWIQRWEGSWEFLAPEP